MTDIIQFLRAAHKFASKYNEVSYMDVDDNNIVEDIKKDRDSKLAFSIITGMYNDIGEMIDFLHNYYTQTNNKKMLRRLNSLIKLREKEYTHLDQIQKL